MIFETYKHLLPDSRAWRITASKNLRNFFLGLSESGDDARIFSDQIWQDIDPQLTRELDAWEDQFGLPPTLTNESERRSRLEAEWKALGGQSPRYIQDTLQGAGFNVFVHDPWTDFTGVPVDPRLYLTDNSSTIQYISADNNPDMQDGDVAGAIDGNTIQPPGYPLVNGDYDTVTYTLPVDPALWPYFFYIGGETFPEVATVQNSRRGEFETLCLKICPAHVWLGMLINYS